MGSFQFRLSLTVFLLCLAVVSFFAVSLHWSNRVEMKKSFALELHNQFARALPLMNNILGRQGAADAAELEDLRKHTLDRGLFYGLYRRTGEPLLLSDNFPQGVEMSKEMARLPMDDTTPGGRPDRLPPPPPEPDSATPWGDPGGLGATPGWNDPMAYPPPHPPPSQGRGQRPPPPGGRIDGPPHPGSDGLPGRDSPLPGNPPRRPPRLDRLETLEWKTSSGHWLVSGLRYQEFALFVGGSTEPLEESLRAQLLRFSWMLPLASLFAAFGAAWVAGRALRPLRKLTHAMAQISAEGLGQRMSTQRMDREFRELTEIFNHMLDRLQSSFQQARRFSADAAHELNTPLMVFLGHLETALQQAPDDSEEQRRMALLLEETERMRDLVEKLLLLSRADNHALPLQVSQFDLSAMAAEILDDVRAVAGDKTISLESYPVSLQADASLIRAILYNLLSNAIKYSPEEASIRVQILIEDGKVKCSVANTGQAMPAEVAVRLFDRFYRADEARQRTGGLGLGLSLAREFARAHKGNLSLAKNGRHEIVFLLELPLRCDG